MSILFLDTNIISDMMRNLHGPAATRAIQASRSRGADALYTSVVVQCELAYGLLRNPNPRLQAAYDAVMDSIEVLPVDATVVSHYAQLRTNLESQGTPIGPNDTLIAAHALALGATLVTADGEFSRVPGLKVENWLQ